MKPTSQHLWEGHTLTLILQPGKKWDKVLHGDMGEAIREEWWLPSTAPWHSWNLIFLIQPALSLVCSSPWQHCSSNFQLGQDFQNHKKTSRLEERAALCCSFTPWEAEVPQSLSNELTVSRQPQHRPWELVCYWLCCYLQRFKAPPRPSTPGWKDECKASCGQVLPETRWRTPLKLLCLAEETQVTSFQDYSLIPWLGISSSVWMEVCRLLNKCLLGVGWWW